MVPRRSLMLSHVIVSDHWNIKAEGLLTATHGSLVICKGQWRLEKSSQWEGGHHAGEGWVLLMVMSHSTIDARSMDKGTMRVAVAPLLQSWFTVGELLAAHGAGGAFSFVGRRLRADCPLLARSANESAWGSDVMREGGGGYLDVIVSADRMFQLSVNDGGWDVTFSCCGFPAGWYWELVSVKAACADGVVVPSKLELNHTISGLAQC